MPFTDDIDSWLQSMEQRWEAGEIGRRDGNWLYFHLGGGHVAAANFAALVGNLALVITGAIALKRVEVAIRRRFDVRWRPDHCAACGYNLTGNVTGVCPECGKPLPEEQHRSESS